MKTPGEQIQGHERGQVPEVRETLRSYSLRGSGHCARRFFENRA